MSGISGDPRVPSAAGDGSGVCQVRLGEMVKTYDVTDPGCGLYDPLRRLILAVREDYGYLVR